MEKRGFELFSELYREGDTYADVRYKFRQKHNKTMYTDDENLQVAVGCWRAAEALAKKDRNFMISYCLYFNVDDLQSKNPMHPLNRYIRISKDFILKYKNRYMPVHAHTD